MATTGPTPPPLCPAAPPAPAQPFHWPRALQLGLAFLLGASSLAVAHYTWRRHAEPARPADARDALPTPRKSEIVLYRLDLNTATQAELRQLPGVGPELARRIVEERELHGPFASVDQLRRVPGFGPATLDPLRARVMVDTDAAATAEVAEMPSRAAGKSPPSRPVDLNRAGKDELMKLPGIGPGLADRILAHRAAKGYFARVEDVTRIDGIKAKTLAKIRPFVYVEGEARSPKADADE